MLLVDNCAMSSMITCQCSCYNDYDILCCKALIHTIKHSFIWSKVVMHKKVVVDIVVVVSCEGWRT